VLEPDHGKTALATNLNLDLAIEQV